MHTATFADDVNRSGSHTVGGFLPVARPSPTWRAMGTLNGRNQSTMSTERTNRFLTVAEAADFARVSKAIIYQLVAERRLPHLRIGLGRGCIRITQQDLDEFLEKCRVPEFSLRA
jgi:excisionase family DNA binding protein